MPREETQSRKALQLDYRDADGIITVTPSDQDRFMIKIKRATEVLQLSTKLDDFRAQINILLKVLATWLQDQPSAREAYLTIRDGALAFVVISSISTYDEEFEDRLSELDIEIARDPDLVLIQLNTICLPDVSTEALDGFVNSEMVIEIPNANRS